VPEPQPRANLGRGRRPKYSPAFVQEFCAILRMGGTRTAACNHVGLDTSTFYVWLERHPAFSGDVARAEADAELRFSNVVRLAAGKGDWRAAAFWLERRRPTDWGEKIDTSKNVVLDVSALLKQHLVRPPEPVPLPDPQVIDLPVEYDQQNGHVTD